MDSVSQFALGAAVGLAVMGRHTAPWKAALAGGLVGTLPDLDALIDHGDAVRNMTMHRGPTHAIFWQSLASPFIAAVVAGLDRGAPRAGALPGGRPAARAGPHFLRWWAAVWLVLVTHALLDAATVYGTRLALPFSAHPFGLGSIFIIDPLYTLPLLVGLAATLRTRGAQRWRWNRIGLALSTAYLGWGLLAQAHVGGIVREQLAGRGAQPAQLLVTPTPFNSMLWRVLALYPEQYEEGFYALLDRGREIRFDRFERFDGRAADPALRAEAATLPAVARVAEFSGGFFRLREHEGRVVITDLRMGQEPLYVFSFEVARRTSALTPVTPVPVDGRDGGQPGGRFDWLGRARASFAWMGPRLLGEDLPPPRPR